MPKKCIPADEISKSASIDMAETAIAIETSYNKTFGIPLNNTKILELDVKDIKKNLTILKQKRKFAVKEKKIGDVTKLTKKIGEKNRKLKIKLVELKNEPIRFKKTIALKDLMVGTVQEFADSRAGDVHAELYFPIIQEFVMKRYGPVPFNKLKIQDLDKINRRLGVIYKQQGKRKNKPLPPWKRKVQDPAILMLKQDPTGLAFDLVQRTHRAPDEIFSITNKYRRLINDSAGKMRSWMEINNYLFRTNRVDGEITPTIVEQSFENVIKFAFDVLDGRAKYIIPQPIGSNKEENAAFLEDEDRYNLIVKRNILDDINEGAEIQHYPTGKGEDFYYVAIKQPPEHHEGREVYYGYEVPHVLRKPKKEGDKPKPFLFLPRSDKPGAIGKEKRESFDAALGQGARFATYTNNIGRETQGRFPEGWHEAKTHKKLSGTKEEDVNGFLLKKPFDIYSYGDFRENTNINNTDDTASQEIPKEFWKMIADIRFILKDFHGLMRDKNATTESIRQDIFNQIKNKPNKKMTSKEADKFIKSVTNLDGMRSNMYVDSAGDIISTNTEFSELYNYVPWKRTPNDLIVGTINTRDDMIQRRKDMQEALGIKEEVDLSTMSIKEQLKHVAELTDQNREIDSLLEFINHYNQMIEVYTGKRSMHEVDRLDQIQTLGAAQQRKNFMDPIERYNEDGSVKSYGRLANMDVFGEYFEQQARTMVHNDISNHLFNVGLKTSIATSEYMLDHVKATFGHADVDAGILGFDYSNPRIAEILNKVAKKAWGRNATITAESIYAVARALSMLISGNLLGLGPALNNNMQRISVIIKTTDVNMKQVKRMMNDGTAERVAALAGTTDTTVGLADSLFGMMSSELTIGTGWLSKKDLSILTLSRLDSIKAFKKKKVWHKFFQALIDGQSPGAPKATATELKNMYDGTWRLIHGIQDNSLSEEDLEGIRKSFEGKISKELINRYASWGLSGHYAAGWLSTHKEWKAAVTFVGVEESMRKWTTAVGSAWYVHSAMPDDVKRNPEKYGLKSAYEHPMALKMGRLLVNTTMFGLSPQFLMPALRGAFGISAGKFFPYTILQGREELTIAINYIDSLSDTGWAEIMKEVTSMFLVPPFLGDRDPTVVGVEMFGKEYIKPRGKRSEAFNAAKKFLWTRVLFSIMLTPTVHIPGISQVAQFIRRQVQGSAYGIGLRATERGGTSVWANGIIKSISAFMAIAGLLGRDYDEEDKEEIYTEWYRFFFPMYLNLAIDLANRKPLNTLRAFSQAGYRVGNALKVGIEWAGLYDFEDVDLGD